MLFKLLSITCKKSLRGKSVAHAVEELKVGLRFKHTAACSIAEEAGGVLAPKPHIATAWTHPWDIEPIGR